MPIPLSGQGKELPQNLTHDGNTYRGQWLLEGRMFLYIPEKEPRDKKTGMPIIFHDDEGKWKLGFDSSMLASALGVDANRLLTANQTGELELVSALDVPPSGGAISAKTYTFKLGIAHADVTVHTGNQIGTA